MSVIKGTGGKKFNAGDNKGIRRELSRNIWTTEKGGGLHKKRGEKTLIIASPLFK
jgi:hypothetical protein